MPPVLFRVKLRRWGTGRASVVLVSTYIYFLNQTNDSYQKVCNFLCLFQYYQPEKTKAVPSTQEELASITGLTRVQIARVTARPRDSGIIDSSRRKIHIIDIDTPRKSCLSLIQPE